MSKKPPDTDGQLVRIEESADRHRSSRQQHREDTEAQATTAASHAIGYKSEMGPDHSTWTGRTERTTASPIRDRGPQSSDNWQTEQAPTATVGTARRPRRIQPPSKTSEKSKSQQSKPALDTSATSKAKVPKGAVNASKRPGSVQDRQTTRHKGQAGQAGLPDRRANPAAEADVSGTNPDQGQSSTTADEVDQLSTAQSYLASFYALATTLAATLAALLSGPRQQPQVVSSSPGAFCAASVASTVKNASDQQGPSSTYHSPNPEQTSLVCSASSPGATSAETKKPISGRVPQGLNEPVAKALEDVPSIETAKTPEGAASASPTDHVCSAERSPDVAPSAAGAHKGDMTASPSSPTTRVLKEAATILSMSPLRFPGTKKDDTIGIRALTVVSIVVAAIGFFSVIGFFFTTNRPSAKLKGYCDTDGCLYHTRTLTRKLNQSISPCDDFTAYVCSAWVPSGVYSEQTKSPIDGILYSRFIGFPEMLANGARELPVGEKARVMHVACMDSAAQAVANIEEFRRLMQAMRLSWPEPPREDSNALGVLLSLGFQWQIPLWIAVNPPALQKTDWRLRIRPGDYIPLLKNQYVSVTSGDVYEGYWLGFYNAFRTSATIPLGTRQIKRVADAEGRILEQLHKAFISKKKIPAVLPLAVVGNFTAPVSSSEWLEQLTLSLAFRPKFVASDQIAVSDTGFLAAVGGLFANYTHQRLIEQLSWLFVQAYAPISDPKLQTARYGDTWKADMYRPILCAHHVESSMKMLVFALNYVSGYTQRDTELVNAGLTRLIYAASSKINGSGWLDEESKARAVRKIHSVLTFLWPAKQWIRNEFLSSLYNDYPSEEDTFGDYWIKARFAVAKHDRTAEFEATLNLPSNIPPPSFGYDYVTNSIALPIGIVDRPLYYGDGNKAMFYGGLGFLIALQIASALDSVGITWDAEDRNVASVIASDASMKAFEEKDGCLEDEGIESIFPEVPALEIAHAAFQRAVQNDKDGAPAALRGLSPDKVFFMTLCYMACTTLDAKHAFGADCHKAVRNSPAFQAAFSCPSGSKMNPTRKCTFFD
ncbi:endothelin-converting enzyme 1-like [Dermacentor variabilis]|uniref:endothelin-converting enzyme 1-like n=1 Tax=Dermacentor variabilis TaxID=34621 RepID=UPI003F5C701B